MAWLRIDDGFTKHPKFEGWPPSRRWAWLEAMEYCARYDTRGRIPNDLSLLPKSVTETVLVEAEKAGWIDRDEIGQRWVHDWKKYNPADPTKAQRQAKWRARVDAPVDNNVDDDVDATNRLQEPSTDRLPRARASAPVPVPSRPQDGTSSLAAEDPSYEADNGNRGDEDQQHELETLGFNELLEHYQQEASKP